MTTLDDTLAYVLANPLESVGHCALVDRVTEEYSERHARGILLGFVIAAPENDGVRLAFAEWCQRNGQPRRGEFIRLQCEIGRVHYQLVHDLESPITPVASRLNALIERESEMYHTGDFFELIGDFPRRLMRGWVMRIENEDPDPTRSLYFRRGFAELAITTAAGWMQCGDAIRREHPVTRVRLTTMPEVEHDPLNQDGKPFPLMWFKGRMKRLDVPLGYPIGHRHWVDRLLEFEWPGVAFDIPAVTYADWDTAPSATPIDDLRSWQQRLNEMSTAFDEQAPFDAAAFERYRDVLRSDLLRAVTGLPEPTEPH